MKTISFEKGRAGQPEKVEKSHATDDQQPREEERDLDFYQEEEEDPYNICEIEQIYDTVEEQSSVPPEIVNRPPAPIPRPIRTLDMQENITYISRGKSGPQQPTETKLRSFTCYGNLFADEKAEGNTESNLFDCSNGC